MKQRIFTIVMMLALVVVTSSAWAQGSLAPYANGTTDYPYQWTGISGVKSGGYAFYVTTDVPTTTNVSTLADQSDAHYVKGTTTYGATSSITIKWKNAAANGTYYVSLVLMSSSDCYNFRYVEVKPKAPVEFVIYAVGVSGAADGTGLTFSETGKNGGNECPPVLRVGSNFDSGDVTPDAEGNVYVFFRVDRVNGTSTNSWQADIELISSIGSGTIVTTHTSKDASTWDSSALGVVTNSTTITETLYIRATVNVPAGTAVNTFTSNIAQNTTHEVQGDLNIIDYTSDDNSAAYTINNVPEVGAFSGN